MRAIVAMVGVALVMSQVPAQASDARYSCARGETVRTVAVVKQPASGRACEVHYEKTSMGGAPEVLWHADTDVEFCADQARTLVSRLSGAGWTCSDSAAMSASAATPEPLSVAVEVPKPPGSGVTAATSAASRSGAPSEETGAPVDYGFRLRPSIH